MTRRSVASLADGDTIDDIYLARDKQLRTNRTGNLYVQLELADRTGMLMARMWNAGQGVFGSFADGDLVRVAGKVQAYQGALQVICNTLEKASPEGLNPEEFVARAPTDPAVSLKRVSGHVAAIADFPLRTLAESILLDHELMEKFMAAPAGVSAHHAYVGGLVEHVATMMDIAHAIAPLYTGLDRDTLIVGILIHDIGKVEELSVGQGFAYTDAGQLLGHLALGQDMVSAKIVEVEKTLGTQFPPQTRLRLFHMLLSHHGLLEHGSPKLPMTPEAVALHQIDSMDSRMNMVLRHIEENRAQGAWAPWHPALQRRLYRGPV